MVHHNAKFAGVLIQFHGEIGGFLIQRVVPIQPATANAVLFHQALEIAQEVVRKVVPEIKDGFSAAAAFQELEQLAIGGNELGARDHGVLL